MKRMLLTMAGLLLASPAWAQADYPNRPVTIVAPATPGGFYSIVAKQLGDFFQPRLKVPFVVEHKPGAGTAVGAAYAARSAPDGHTLLVAATPTLAVQPAMLKRPLYDPVADFEPIGMLALSPTILVVNASLGINSLADLVKEAKANPGKLKFASNGAGSVLHLAGEVLKRQLDIDIQHVAYRGGVPALTDIAGGHVHMMFAPYTLVEPLVDAGKLKMIGVSTKERIEAVPQVPPLSEVGAPGYHVDAWFMLVAPGKTPPAIVERLHREVLAWAPTARAELIRGGSIPVVSESPAKLKAFVAAEVPRWRRIVEQAGLAASE